MKRAGNYFKQLEFSLMGAIVGFTPPTHGKCVEDHSRDPDSLNSYWSSMLIWKLVTIKFYCNKFAWYLTIKLCRSKNKGVRSFGFIYNHALFLSSYIQLVHVVVLRWLQLVRNVQTSRTASSLERQELGLNVKHATSVKLSLAKPGLSIMAWIRSMGLIALSQA